MLKKRILAALLCLFLTAGLWVTAYGAEAPGKALETEAVREDADGPDFYALEAPAMGAAALRARGSSTDVAYAVEGGNIYFDPDTGEITKCDRRVTSAVIPDDINGVRVTGIGTWAFQGCSSLTNVRIPEGVTSIGDHAFYGRSGLTSVRIPEGVTSIGNSAFSGCSGLTSVIIPESVTSIGVEAFKGCSGLTSVIIPEGVTSIGHYTFLGCSGLTNAGPIGGWYNIEFGWTQSIPADAFSGCSSLTSVSVPEGVTSIGNSAFSGCSGLTSVSVPEGVTSIGNRAFKGCSGLTSVTIPEGVTSIGDYAFQECSNLASVTIAESVTRIGSWAFRYCSNLTKVTIPANLSHHNSGIGSESFYNCTSVSYVKVTGQGEMSNSIKDVWQYSKNNSLVVVLEDGVTSIGYHAFFGCGALTSVTIPGSVTNIGDSAFCGCSGLTSVTIPGSVTSIGDNAFSNCSSLRHITISDGVTNIGKCTFFGCNSLEHVTIPHSVTSIGRDAFEDCGGLTSAGPINSGYNIEFGWTESIPALSFYGCSGLTSVTIPESVTSIGDSAFSNCSSLRHITISDGVTNIGKCTFFGCNSLEHVTIPHSVTSIGRNAFGDCGGLTSAGPINSGYNIEFGWTESIPALSFYGCSGLTSVTIPESVTSIGVEAFSGCSGLRSVTIPGSVTSIGVEAFEGCSSLRSLTISDGVTSIGQRAFKGCSGLTSVMIPNSVTSIGYGAFSGCTSVSYVKVTGQGDMSSAISRAWKSSESESLVVILENGITSICGSAFSGCSGLTGVTIPNSVTSIGGSAFSGCSALTDVYYDGTQSQWNAITISSDNSPLTDQTSGVTIHCKSSDPGATSGDRGKLHLGLASRVCVGDLDRAVNTVFVDWTSEDIGKTISWQSSNPAVFELTGQTSHTYNGGPASWSVRGNVRSGGASVVTITTSEGDSVFFTVWVEEGKNAIRLSGDRALLTGESAELSAKIALNIFHIGDTIEWRSSDGSVLAFDRGGTESVSKPFTTIPDSPFTDRIRVYARGSGKATVTCRLPASGAEASFEVRVSTERDRKVQEFAHQWLGSYSEYIQSLKDRVEEAASSDIRAGSLDDLAKQFESELGEKYGMRVAAGGTPKRQMVYAYKALLEMMASYTSTELVISGISLEHLDKVPMDIVNNVAAALQSTTYEYQEGNITVAVSLFDYAGARFGQATISELGKTGFYTVGISSSRAAVKNIISDYMLQLLDLQKALAKKAYKEARKDLEKAILGQSISNLTQAKISNYVAKHTRRLAELGLGDVTKTLNSSCNYYQFLKKVIAGDTDQLGDMLMGVKDISFSDPSIENKIAKRAVQAMEGFHEDIMAAITGEPPKKESWLTKAAQAVASIFNCPVNITVFDSAGRQVGYIGDDGLEYDESVIFIERCGESKIIYSKGEALSYELTGMDDGVLNCIFEEYRNGAAIGRVNYYDIPLYEGAAISAEVAANELTVNNVTVTAEEKKVFPNEMISAADYDGASVDIACLASTAAGGETYGTGIYVRGDAVSIQAVEKADYVFLGWQDSNGALVSISPVYEFTAKEDETFTALFSKQTVEGNTINVISWAINDKQTIVSIMDTDDILTNNVVTYAVFYDGEWMSDIVPGHLDAKTITFDKELTAGWTLFFLDSTNLAPLCKKSVLK